MSAANKYKINTCRDINHFFTVRAFKFHKQKILKYKIDIYPVSYVIILFITQIIACLSLSPINALFFSIISLYFMSVPAAFNHHHQHHNTFYQPILNRLLEMILGLQTGITPYMWVIHHNMGHHPFYLDQTRDTSRWKKNNSNEIMGKTEYALFNSFLNGFIEVRRIGKIFPKLYRRYQISRIMYYAIMIILLYLIGLNFFIIVLVPSLIVVYYTIETTWHHHAGLDADNHYFGSRNNISKFFNFRTCNLGYHTAHHIKPGLHWSLLPEFHAEIADKIPPHLIRSIPWHA